MRNPQYLHNEIGNLHIAVENYNVQLVDINNNNVNGD